LFDVLAPSTCLEAARFQATARLLGITPDMHDVVIVGSRCAGAPLAMLLARSGRDVLLVDRTTFPSDTMSTHFIQAPGMARLVSWGLLDAVLATGCPPVTRARFHTAGEDALEVDIPLHGLPGMVSPRRYVLDKILVDAAVAAGAQLAEGVSVDSLIHEDGRVAGVRGHTSTGEYEARGRFIVGADGRHSVVARETGAPFVKDAGPTSAGYYSYYSDVEWDTVETFFHEDRFCVTFPTNDDLLTVAVAWPPHRFKEVRRDIEGSFLTALDGLGDIGERVRAGTRAERFVGAADVPNYLRAMRGPGWALVGDAAYHKDPAPADGISDAFRGAEYLASAIDEVLSGGDEEAAFAGFEERHAAVALPLLDAAVRTSSFDGTPQERRDAFIEIRMHDAVEVDGLAS
jgi:flavin-dependent dehydrogenase